MFNLISKANIHPENGIHYGAISGYSLDPDVLNVIQDKVFDLEYQVAYKDHLKNLLQDVIDDSNDLTVQQLIDKCEANDIDPDLDGFAVNFDALEPLLLKLCQFLAVFPFTAPHDGGEEEEFCPLRHGCDAIDHL